MAEGRAAAVTPAADRLALVAAAVGDVEGVEASSIEIDRGGTSYTADTVNELERDRPGDELFLIVGADVASTIGTWERLDELRRKVDPRRRQPAGHDVRARRRPRRRGGWRGLGAGVRLVEVPALEISSTDLRDRAASGRPLEYLVPDAAIRLIRSRSLYAHDR